LLSSSLARLKTAADSPPGPEAEEKRIPLRTMHAQADANPFKLRRESSVSIHLYIFTNTVCICLYIPPGPEEEEKRIPLRTMQARQKRNPSNCVGEVV